MAERFVKWAKGWRLAFNDSTFRAFVRAAAAVGGDRIEEEARQAVLESLPSTASDEKSLGLFGADVGIERGPTETAADYADRLSIQAYLNRLRGKPLGLLLGLEWAEFTGAVVVTINGLAHYLSAAPSLQDIKDAIDNMEPPTSWYTIVDMGPNPAIPAVSAEGKSPAHGAIAAGTRPWWFYDHQWAKTHRFGILFPAPTAIDLTIPENLARIRRVIRNWKPANAKCLGIWVNSTGAVWGWPPGNMWGGGGMWGGGAVAFFQAE